MENSQEYRSAKERVEAKMGFYEHFLVYVAVIMVINLMTASSTIWFHWPMIGWGVAVAIHAAVVFVFPERFAVTERMIEKEMGKERTRP